MSHRVVAPEFALLATIWRRRGLVLALAVVAALAGGLAYLTKPPGYEAQASLMFRFEREYFPDNPANDEWRGDSIRVALDEAIHTEMEILGSRRLLADALARAGGVEAWAVAGEPPIAGVLAALGLPPSAWDRLASALSPAYWRERLGWAPARPPAAAPATPDAADGGVLAGVRQALSLRRIEGTMVVDVAMRHADGAFAERFVAALIDAYLAQRDAIFGTPPLDAMSAELEAARARVSEAERALVAYRAEHGLFDLERQRGALLDQLADVRTTLDSEVEQRIASTAAFIARAEGEGEDPVGARVTLAGLETERSQLLERRARVERELAALMDDSPALNARERELAAARAELERVEALASERALEARLATAAGPVISVIDPPARLPGTTGLSLVATLLLTGAIGAVVGALLALWRGAAASGVPKPDMAEVGAAPVPPAAGVREPATPRAHRQSPVPAFEAQLDDVAAGRRRRR